MLKIGATRQTEDLTARRKVVLRAAKDLLNHADSHGGITQAVSDKFDGLLAEADRLQSQIELSYRMPQSQRIIAGIDQHSSQHTSGHPDELRAFNNFLKFGIANLSADDRDIMLKLHDASAIYDAQSVGTGSGGGFAVPDEAMRPLVEALKSVGGVLPFCTIVPSNTGADLPIPTDNETAVEGEIVNENSQHNEGDVTLAQVVLSSFLYSSKLVRVSIQLMDDAGFDFGAFCMRKLGERIGRITAKHWITGDGSSKPRGITVAAPVGKTAASATAVTYDELVDVLHSVDPIYRQKGTWLMNDVSFSSLRKLKDSQNRPLYGELANSEPNMLLGHKISIDPNMPSMATGNKAIVFGDLSNYFVRIVKQPRVVRLEERYAEFSQLGFLAFLRADGDLVDGGGGAVKALAMA